MAFVVLYDACVLYPAPLRDLLVRLSHTGIVCARWSEPILDECFRNILENRRDLKPEALKRTRELIALGNSLGGVMLGFPGTLAGDEDTAAVFDGVDDQVDFGDVHDFAGVSAFSVEAWIAPQPSSIGGAICTKQLSAVDGFELVFSDSQELV